MPTAIKRTIRHLRRGAKRIGDAAIGALAVGFIKLLRVADPDWLADAAGWTMRRIGPLLRENRIARDQLTAAFPEKSAPRSRQSCAAPGTISAAWAPNSPISTACGTTNPRKSPGAIEIAPENIERFRRLAEDGKPALDVRRPSR